jgi:ABC-2 type transport system permease protein
MSEVHSVTSLERAAPQTVSADPGWPARFVLDSATIARSELRKVVRDPTELFTRAAQPILWLLVFGQVVANVRAIPTGSLSYMDFLAPGVLAQSALFSAIFYGIGAIWERDLGIAHKLLASPAPRAALVTGKAVTGGIRALIQAAIVYLVAGLLGIHLRLEVGALVGVAAIIVVGSALFAAFSLDVACIVKSRERFMGIGQLLTMPLFFASSAVYPVAIMPDWLKAIATVNPLTYMVDGLRALMVVGGGSDRGLEVDLVVLAGFFALFVAIGARLYPRLGQ